MHEGHRDENGTRGEALNRRGFMIATGAALLAGRAHPAGAQAPAAPPAPIPGKERLTIRSSRPINLEARWPR